MWADTFYILGRARIAFQKWLMRTYIILLIAINCLKFSSVNHLSLAFFSSLRHSHSLILCERMYVYVCVLWLTLPFLLLVSFIFFFFFSSPGLGSSTCVLYMYFFFCNRCCCLHSPFLLFLSFFHSVTVYMIRSISKCLLCVRFGFKYKRESI